jgi:hypothetical protein
MPNFSTVYNKKRFCACKLRKISDVPSILDLASYLTIHMRLRTGVLALVGLSFSVAVPNSEVCLRILHAHISNLDCAFIEIKEL